ncbi:hypothetical protein [Selenomonas sp. AE3005]|uniref:hypothetical protein n=1 Tax=Selenomonas sp. AE3005 TaxID=1485543 RepID=UPI0025EFDEA9|nr:hypothetical protein [Selenomonas sp. AE3005]
MFFIPICAASDSGGMEFVMISPYTAGASVFVFVPLIVSAYIGYDAYKHYDSGVKGIAWFFLALFFPIVGWAIYFLVRPEKKGG